MKKIRNKKGFTLVEIIATVVILGILLTTAIVGYSKYIKKAKNNYYSKQEDLVTQAGRDFFNDNRGRLPVNVGEESCVLLSTLVSNKYIDPVKDYNNKPCNQDKTKVCAQKISLTKYEYDTILICDDTNTSETVLAPGINFKLNDSNFNEGQTFTGQENQSYTIKMELDGGEQNLKSYKYVVHKVGMKNPYYASNSVSLPSNTKTYTVNIPLNTSGTFYVEGISINDKGKKTTKKSGRIKIKINKLECENAVMFSGGSNEWSNSNLTIAFTANSLVKYYYVEVMNAENEEVLDGPIAVGNITGGKNINNYSYQIKVDNGKIAKVYFKVTPYDKDNKNNSCEIKSPVYKIDKSKPTVVMDPSDGLSSTQTIKLQCNDNIEVTGYYYGTTAISSSTTYTTNKTQIKSLANEGITKTVNNGATYYFACKDGAGNVTSTSKTYYKTTLQPNRSTVTPTPILTLAGSTFTIPEPVAISGYAFTSWCSNSELTTCLSKTYKPTANETLYGKWRKLEYTINYTMNGGPDPATKPTKGEYDNDVQISNPSKKVVTVNIDQNFYLFNRDGTIYRKKVAKTSNDTLSDKVTVDQPFNGWTSTTLDTAIAKSGTSSNPSSSWNGSITKNTYFRNLKETGTVTMIANWDGSGSAKLPEIKKFGYVCNYNTKSNGTGTSYEPGDNYKPSATSSSSVTLYPTCKAEEFTIVYAANRENYLLNNTFTNSGKSTGTDAACAESKACTCKDDPQSNIDSSKIERYLQYNSYTSGDGHLYHINEWPVYDPCTVSGYDMDHPNYKYFAHLAKGNTEHGNVVAFPVGDSSNEPNNLDFSFQLSDVLKNEEVYVLSFDIKKDSDDELVLKTGIRDGNDKSTYYSVPMDPNKTEGTSFDIKPSNGWTTKTVVFKISKDYKYMDKFAEGYGTSGNHQEDHINSGRPELFFNYKVTSSNKSKRGTIYLDNVRFYKADSVKLDYDSDFTPPDSTVMTKNGYLNAGWFKTMKAALSLDTSKSIAGGSNTVNSDNMSCESYYDANDNKYNVCYLYAGWFEKEYKVTLNGLPSGISQSSGPTVKFSELPYMQGSNGTPIYKTSDGKVFKGWNEWTSKTSYTSKNDPFFIKLDSGKAIGASNCNGISSYGRNTLPNDSSFEASFNKCGYDTSNSNHPTLRFNVTENTNTYYTEDRINLWNDRFPNISTPGFGGYCQSLDTPLTAGEEYVHVIELAMGDGLYLHYDDASMHVPTDEELENGKKMSYWLTDNEGKASTKMYVYRFVPASNTNKVCVYFSQNYEENRSGFERQHMSANLYFSGVYKASDASSFLGQLCSKNNCSSTGGCCEKTWTAAWKDKPLRVYYKAGGAEGTPGNNTYGVNNDNVIHNSVNYYDEFEEGTVKLTKSPSTFGLKLDGYNIVSGSEWGTDVKLNTNYSWSTIKSKATDMGNYYKLVLTANWKVITGTCTITYDPKGGTLSSNKQTYTCSVNANGTITLRTPTRTGYTFNYWTRKGTTTPTYNGAWSKSNTGDYTLEANWTINTYSITYNANGGSGAPSATTYQYASSGNVKLSTAKPTRSGYTFLGWSQNKNATSAAYQPGQNWSRANTDNYTLYAIWKQQQTTQVWIHTGYTCTYYRCTLNSTYPSFFGAGGGCASGYTYTKDSGNTNRITCHCTAPCGAWKETGYWKTVVVN